jgi:hypothetical protein
MAKKRTMAEQKRREDKIFGNDFNSGNIEFEFFGKIKVKDEFDTTGPEFTDNSFTTWEKQQLQEELYEIFEKSDFRQKYAKIKKVPKNEMVKIYYHFAEGITKEKYTGVQIFLEIAGFMNMNFKDMFHQLLPVDKQRIVQELDEDYHVLRKRNIKKLF